MAALADLERLLERVFERTTARVFRSRLQVVQVERKVERSMERARSTQGTWTVVPSRYRVRLNPADLGSVATDAGGAEELAARLADAALAFARAHGYHLAGRPSVAVVADPAVERAVIEVDAVADVRRPMSSPIPPHAVPDMPVVPARDAAPLPEPSPVVMSPLMSEAEFVPASGFKADPSEPAPVASGPVNPPVAVGGSIRGDGSETLVFRRPAPPTARAMLRVIATDGSERVVEVDGTPLTLGRSIENGLVIADSRVSRHHGRLQARRGTLVFTDLTSTNGSRVNGVRVDECALGEGDRIVVGDTVLLVEHLPR